MENNEKNSNEIWKNEIEVGQTLTQKEQDGKIKAIYQYLSKTNKGDYLQAKLTKHIDFPDKIRLKLGRYSKNNPNDFKTWKRNGNNFDDKYECGVQLKSEELKNLINFLKESKNNTFLFHPEERTIYKKINSEDIEILKLIKQKPTILKELDINNLEYAKNEYDIRSLKIEEFENMIANEKLTEDDWQTFLNENIHILQICIPSFFKYIGEKVYAGGKTINGKDGVYPDYAFTDSLNSIAFIEIKKPQTNLMKENTYRNNAFAPSEELSGGISQVLSQRHIYYSKESDKTENNPFYNSPCYLIIGNLSKLNKKQNQSFSLFRNSFMNINIVAFDEILERLKIFIETIKKTTLNTI
ncbi:hypothetical protein SKUN_001733 (plasmid) [Spiroplasma kunkelii CR2-3x]|uniref:Shedu protein SduA C-terminal domain-containing protein n=1 Tax=Spiroplasma kunkelii CR2-3x TaxID=273035 RepID=A0A0K2JJ19_SPIKU|nr:Shedu immune nuclease family protein [Spiroplasma kunkelii]ALA98585.1 hypothetical protein SKUN_001733 [Spiroplasma kunkelii CR2-3x]